MTCDQFPRRSRSFSIRINCSFDCRDIAYQFIKGSSFNHPVSIQINRAGSSPLSTTLPYPNLAWPSQGEASQREPALRSSNEAKAKSGRHSPSNTSLSHYPDPGIMPRNLRL